MTTPKHLLHRVSLEVEYVSDEVQEHIEESIHESLKRSKFWNGAPFDYIIFRIYTGEKDGFKLFIEDLSKNKWLYCNITINFEYIRYCSSSEKIKKIGATVLSAFSALADHYTLPKDFLDAPELADFFIVDMADYIAERARVNPSKQPSVITISHDTNHARFVGRTSDNTLFFLTTPHFGRDINDSNQQYVGLYTFDQDGVFLKSRFEKLAKTDQSSINENDEKRAHIMEDFLNSLENPVFEDITINIFSILKFQTEAGFIFGSVYGQWFVKANPGNYMYFTQPSDGTYYASYEALKKELKKKYWEEQGGKPKQFTSQGMLIDVTVQDEQKDPGDPPELIIIAQDDDLARFIGNTANGKQFFLTTPFVPAIGDEKGGEFVVLYLFDEEGNFEEAKFESLGARADSDVDNRERSRSQIMEEMLGSLKNPALGNIHIKPFSIEKYGTEFGLILFANSGQWSASVMPGDYMAFSAPWDRGFTAPERARAIA